jgi:hypothetical protein
MQSQQPGGEQPGENLPQARSSLFWREAAKLGPLNYWRMGAIFFLGCFMISVLFFIALQNTYVQVKDVVYRQQTEIIDEQSRIIQQQDQAIRELTGDNTTVAVPRLPRVY